jgi:hypothetical protein
VKLESIVFACVEDRGVVMVSGAEILSPVTRVKQCSTTQQIHQSKHKQITDIIEINGRNCLVYFYWPYLTAPSLDVNFM